LIYATSPASDRVGTPPAACHIPNANWHVCRRAWQSAKGVWHVNGMVWVRVLIGAVWLNGGVEKLLNPSFPRQFAASLQAGGFVSQAPPFFQDFMKGYVVPNAELFAQVMRAGELTLGIALILGLLTNLAAIGSVGLSAVILLSQGGVRLGTGLGSPEFLTINVIVALISLVILFSPAAKAISVDLRLAQRSPGLSPLLINRRQN
jgi:thiosulfate dehydrogenase [quinone] large subunit